MQRRGLGSVAQKPRRSTWRNSGDTMPYNLAQAGAAVGRNRSTILKAIRRGAISATRDPATGGWLIEPAELHRVFPALSPGVAQDTAGDRRDTADNSELRARLNDKDALIAAHQAAIEDLRNRLTESEHERREQ